MLIRVEVASLITDSAGKVTMKVTMNEELTTEGHTYQVFTVVNAGNRIEGITTLGDSRDRVTLKDLWTGTNQVSKADHFIMSTHKMKGVDGIGEFACSHFRGKYR